MEKLVINGKNAWLVVCEPAVRSDLIVDAWTVCPSGQLRIPSLTLSQFPHKTSLLGQRSRSLARSELPNSIPITLSPEWVEQRQRPDFESLTRLALTWQVEPLLAITRVIRRGALRWVGYANFDGPGLSWRTIRRWS